MSTLEPSRSITGKLAVERDGPVLQLACLFGIIAGVYSSIFICSPILIYLGVRQSTVAAPDEPETAPAPAE